MIAATDTKENLTLRCFNFPAKRGCRVCRVFIVDLTLTVGYSCLPTGTKMVGKSLNIGAESVYGLSKTSVLKRLCRFFFILSCKD